MHLLFGIGGLELPRQIISRLPIESWRGVHDSAVSIENKQACCQSLQLTCPEFSRCCGGTRRLHHTLDAAAIVNLGRANRNDGILSISTAQEYV